MGSKKTKTTTDETATTSPNVPGYAMPAITNYYDQVNGLASGVLGTMIQPANQNQQAAYGMGDLFSQGGFDQFDMAGHIAESVNNNLMQIKDAAAPDRYNVAQAVSPDRYETSAVERSAYGPVAQAQLGDFGGIDPARLQVEAAQISPFSGAAGARASQFIKDYENPNLQGWVDAALAEYDANAGRERQAYAAKGALNNAFGGSGYALGEAELIGNQGRGRASTDATLRNQAWQNALTAASGDADRTTNAGIASMQAQSQQAIAQAQLEQQAALANSEMGRDFALENFRQGTNVNLANAGSLNDAISQIFGVNSAANSQDAAARNTALGQFYNTEAQNSQFNAGQQNAANSQFYGTEADLNQFNRQQDSADQLGRLNAANTLMDAGTAGQAYDMNRANTLLNLGNAQWGLDQMNSPAGQAQILSELINGGGLLNLLTGQTINSSGTSTSKQSGGLMGDLLGGIVGLGGAYLSGGGKI